MRRPQRLAVVVAALCLLLVQFALGHVAPIGADAGAPPPAGELRELRSIPTGELGAARPTGLAAGEDGSLFVAYRSGPRTGLLHLSAAEDRLATLELPGLTDPTTLAFDPAHHRLAAFDRGDVIAVADADLRATRPATQRIDADLRVGGPGGATFDPATGAWFVLDGQTRTILRVPMVDGRPRSASRIALTALGGHDLRGLALNPRDGLLYVASPDAGLVYAVDLSGEVKATYSAASLDVRDLRAMVFAASGDPTDNPAAVDLYMADAGDATAGGRVVEATLTARSAVAATTVTPTLVQTLHVSQLNPPSPDPAGITYMPATDRLQVSDSEVEEMPIFQGVNLFQVTRGGQLLDTGVTTAYSREPTGLGFNPADGTLFISDDNAKKVFAVRPGADGRYGTADDPRTAIDTAAFGSQDAEGTEFDPATGHVLIADGLAREVYDVDPVNGVFGDGDDVTTHFDLEQYGVLDPEGIGVDTARNSIVVVDRAGKKVFEVTRAGALVRVIDLAPIVTKNPAGITVAPGSGGGMNYWIVDRGVDNGVDPNENDGKVYEVSVPGDPPPGTIVQDIAVAAGLDDVEERSNGRMWVATTDLDLVVDATVTQTVGVRFTGIGTPHGAQILDAYVQFQTDEVSTGPADLTVRAQASDDAPAFTTNRFDVSSRPTTAASVSWVPASWPTVGAHGTAQRTPNLAPVLQEIVDRPGWAGRALVLVISGSGTRVAESFEGTFAPVLHIEYRAA